MKALFSKITLAIMILIGFLWLIKILLNESSKDVSISLNPDRIRMQEFKINANADTVLKGENGTVLKIDKGTFKDCMGKPVNGQIKIMLKEILSKPDLVLSGLSTTSGGNILETGGILYLNAFKDGKGLCINDSAKIGVIIPAGHIQEGMKIYKGRFFDKTTTVDWTEPEDLLNDYTFEARNLGWLGIDRSMDNTRTKNIILVVSLHNRNNFQYAVVKMIFINREIYLDGFEAGSNRFVFGKNYAEHVRLPAGEPVIILAVAQHKEKTYFDMQEFIPGENHFSVLSLKETTLDEIEATIKERF